MKQYKNNKTNTLVRSQKRQKKRRKGSSYKEEKEKEDDKEDDDDDDVKVDDWQRRYFSDTIIIDISCLHYIQQITQFLILH
jgi:hypothetical protein